MVKWGLCLGDNHIQCTAPLLTQSNRKESGYSAEEFWCIKIFLEIYTYRHQTHSA